MTSSQHHLVVDTCRALGSKGGSPVVIASRLALDSRQDFPLDQVRRILDCHSVFILGGRPLYPITSKELVKRRRGGAEVYIAADLAWPIPTCHACGGPNPAWILKGGGFEDNQHAALLRESLPFSMCELCFRTCILNQAEPIAVGIAVLPRVTRTKLHDQCLRALGVLGVPSSARQVAEYLEFDVLAVERALDFLAFAEQVLHPTVEGDALTGQLTVLYSREKVPGLALSLAKQTSPQGLFGFSELTAVRVRIPPGIDVIRSAADFCWLRDELALTHHAQHLLPLLPAFQHVGRFNAGFLNDRVQALAAFLAHCATRPPWRVSPALEAFCRPGFEFAKAAVRTSPRAQAAPPTNQPRPSARLLLANKLLAEQLSLALRDQEQLARAFAELDMSALEPFCRALSPSDEDKEQRVGDNVLDMVEFNIQTAARQVSKWTACRDKLLL